MASSNKPTIIRTIVLALLVVVVITTITLVALTEFPIWAGLLLTAGVIVPGQLYLNHTKNPKP
jgi:heme A synthase